MVIFRAVLAPFIILVLLALSVTSVAGPPTPAEAATPTQVPVLVLRYFPTLNGYDLDASVTGFSETLNNIRNKTTSLNTQLVDSLTDGSAFHGNTDPAAIPSLQYSIVEDREFLKPVPESTQFPGRGDKFLMLSDDSIGVSDICDYVDNNGVKQVWVWMYHTSEIAPTESNMAMGVSSQAYWNYGTYGDVSNSAQVADLPVCQQTYSVFEYNYNRALGEALENHGHHLERLYSFADSTVFNEFTSPRGAPSPTINSCGNVHEPPNTTVGYDWYNETDVLSDCEDWRLDGSGASQTVDCHTWAGSVCSSDSGAQYKIWWMQNTPGREFNDGYENDPAYCALRNWWDFTGDFDAAVAVGKNLLVAGSDTVAPTVTLSAPSGGSILSEAVTLSASASDAGCGLEDVKFAISELDGTPVVTYADSSPPYSVSWPTYYEPNGTYRIEATATDIVGNTTTTTPITVTLDNICSDINGDAVVDLTTDVLGLARYLDMTSTDPGFYAIEDYDLLGDGVIQMDDVTGHYFQDCGTGPDTTAPQVSFITPSEGALAGVPSILSVEVQSLDDLLTDRVQFYVDGVPADEVLGLIPGTGYGEVNDAGVDSVAAFKADFDVSSWAAGQHTLGAVATDHAGNSSLLTTVSVIVPADTDADGYGDVLESLIGTDPLDACPDDTSDDAWPPDLNNDGTVDLVNDILGVINLYGKTSSDPDWNTARRADLDGDGAITQADIDIVLAIGGSSCSNEVPRITDLTIDASSASSAALSWTAVPGVAGYERCVNDLPHTTTWTCTSIGNVSTATIGVPGTQRVDYVAVRVVALDGETGALSNRATITRLNVTDGGVAYNSYHTAYKDSNGDKRINSFNLGTSSRYLGFGNLTDPEDAGSVAPGTARGSLVWLDPDLLSIYGPVIVALESPNSTLSPQKWVGLSTLCMIIDEALCP